MTHPTKKQVQSVIDTLTKSLELIGSGLDTENSDSCGTVLCHAGHYYVGKEGIPRGSVSFITGADLMAWDLGFDSLYGLLWWAKHHPEIWGNSYGEHMFSMEMAFSSSKRPNGAHTPVDIIDHWKEILPRLNY